MNFGKIFSNGRRLVVFHHTHLLGDVRKSILPNDIVFFDDCLYSQYIFLSENLSWMKSIGVSVVLGLSPKAMRKNGEEGIYGIESRILHEKMNSEISSMCDIPSGDYIRGFMCKSEVDELLKHDQVFLALHGCCHLKLERIQKKFNQSSVFARDVREGKDMLLEMGLETDIFVYPYGYVPFLGNRILSDFGFRYIFADDRNSRIPIEELVHGF